MKEKNPKKFSIKMQKKLLCLYVLIILAFILLSFRLSWIVRADGADYEKQVLSQQKYDSITLPFRRGDIVDAKGTKLAVSEKVYNLVIDARVMLDREDYLEPTMEALAANFPDLDMTAVRQYVTSHPESSWYVPLRRMTYDQISGFQAAALENGKIVATSNDLTKATYRLARGMCKKDSSFVTIISGCDVSDEDAEQVTEIVKAKCPNHVEVSHIRGGQPVYYYMISVE